MKNKQEKQQEKKSKDKEEKQKSEKPLEGKKIQEEKLIRILSKDIPGNKSIYSGLTLINGVSWALSNAICKKLKINRKRKIEELNKEEIEELNKFIERENLPEFLLNRRKDFDSGKEKHLTGADLDLQKDFDIKRQRKIRSYKGNRHAFGLPVRGQRTKSNFRKNRKKGGAVGVSKKGVKRS